MDKPGLPMISPFGQHHPRIDPSVYIHPSAVIIGEVSLSQGCSVWPHVTLRGDVGAIVVGPETSIQDGTVIHSTKGLSRALIGQRVTIGHNVTYHGAIVEDYCLIGMGAILMDNARIGAWSIVGAGALVTSNLTFPPRSLILGSPAKVARSLTEAEIAKIDQSWRNYLNYAQFYKEMAAKHEIHST